MSGRAVKRKTYLQSAAAGDRVQPTLTLATDPFFAPVPGDQNVCINARSGQPPQCDSGMAKNACIQRSAPALTKTGAHNSFQFARAPLLPAFRTARLKGTPSRRPGNPGTGQYGGRKFRRDLAAPRPLTQFAGCGLWAKPLPGPTADTSDSYSGK